MVEIGFQMYIKNKMDTFRPAWHIRSSIFSLKTQLILRERIR